MSTLDLLQDKIQRELAWRKREVSDLRSLAMRSEETDFHIFRSGQVLLCAHWEGFLKKTAKLYLDHVFSQNIRLRDFAPNIIAAALFRDVMKAADAEYPGSEEHHVRLAKGLVDGFERFDARCTWDVKTEGNPGSDVLKRVLCSTGVDESLGMDDAKWSTTLFFINDQLVRDRHAIAHREGLRIPKVSFLERAARLLELLDTVALIFLDTAERRAYLATQSGLE